jgi:hypothetical protein
VNRLNEGINEMNKETEKSRRIVLMANEMLQETKIRNKTGLKPPRGKYQNKYEELLMEAWNFSYQYRCKWQEIVTRGRNGKFEGVKITYLTK